MDIKSFFKDSAEKEKKNHRIINIMAVAILSLTIIFTLCFGVKVNIGSAVMGDGKDVYVKQNIFQITSVALSSNMTQEEAITYVEEINRVLVEEYGIADLPTALVGDTAFHHLEEFDVLVSQLGDNASKINLLKYKFAYSLAIGNFAMEHQQSYSGSRITSIVGQLVLILVVQAAMLAISLITLVFAILALIKGKRFSKIKMALILLLVGAFANILMFSAITFIAINWAGVLSIAVALLGTLLVCLWQYILMDKRDFSFTMLVHNIVLLGGSLLAFALFISPLFKITGGSTNNVSQSIGWGYLMDYMLAEKAYMSAVMAYTLTEIIMLVTVMLPAILLIILAMLQISRFISADYQYNEKRVFIVVTLVANLIIAIIFIATSAGGGLSITSQYFDVKLNVALLVIQLLTVLAMLVFEILYKVKPVKKELVIR